MLDVGAVAYIVLRDRPEPERQAWTLLTCLHDVGKFSDSFRRQIEESRAPRFSHWQLSDHHLLRMKSELAQRLGMDPEDLSVLLPVVSGHHGRPPDRNRHDKQVKAREIGTAATAAADAALDALLALLPEAGLAFVDEAAARVAGWQLGGLIVEADWIGSNQLWFPYVDPPLDPLEYWRGALQAAEEAVREAGVLPAGIALGLNTASLCNVSELRPMQQAAADIALPDGPMLALIEDTTGAGKTEAALVLAYRMMAAGKAEGLYFALPTTATADQIWTRLGPIVSRMFAEPPSLALSHGRSALHRGFREGLRAGDEWPEEAGVPGCAAWIADDRRRAFLAEVGVGTIDQAILGVLPVRYGLLRLWGLCRRLLIIDEAHAFDPYMREELRRLLHFHAMLGGSAIVMTATLPAVTREAYLDGWREGAGMDRPAPEPGSAPYPSLTVAGGSGIRVQSVEAAAFTRRRVAVTRLDTAKAAHELLAAAAGRGAACVWIRNSVDEAIAACEALRRNRIEAFLLHARFAMADRQRIETEIVALFGRDADPQTRRGKVLVATQIVEASLDLDFDAMISDLAPVDSLIQRAGRLWRHMDLRPAELRPLPAPVLHVLSPDPDDVRDARWLNEIMDGGAFVYPHSVQWRSARALFAAGGIDAPDGLRALLEGVYGAGAPSVPEALARAEQQELGSSHADKTYARHNLLDPLDGYLQFARAADDATFPTRLGPEQVTLALARREGRGLVPYADDPDPVRAWALSEVRLARRKWEHLGGVSQDTPDITAAKAGWPEWRRTAVHVVPLEDLIGTRLDYECNRGLCLKSRDSGDGPL